ncbi:hypothetical protein [Sinomonas sp. P10A9]|uniref:Uncharacterized protein n=1 Tax=Sinomonas puerhi TaxID=3238584 RepID=A0AB39L508_9MICC
MATIATRAGLAAYTPPGVPRRMDSRQLRRGVAVHVTADGQYLGEGTVDGLSRDGSTLWVQFAGIEGRRMFLSTDDVRIGLGRGRPGTLAG